MARARDRFEFDTDGQRKPADMNPPAAGGPEVVPLFGEARGAAGGRSPRTGFAASAVADWRSDLADALARLAAFEQRTFEAIDGLARRVDTLERDMAALRGRDEGQMRALEARMVELSDRIEPLEDRLLHLGRRR